MKIQEYVRALLVRVVQMFLGIIEEARASEALSPTSVRVPESKRMRTSFHEATHAAFFLAVFGEGVVDIEVPRLQTPESWFGRFGQQVRETDSTRIHYGMVVFGLAPSRVIPRFFPEGGCEYGAESDVHMSWEIGLDTAAMEHDPPLYPGMFRAHREELEPAARVIVVEAAALIDGVAERLLPLIRDLAERVFEDEKLEEKAIMEIFERHGSPRIDPVPQRLQP